jgi:hypothetical protein
VLYILASIDMKSAPPRVSNAKEGKESESKMYHAYMYLKIFILQCSFRTGTVDAKAVQQASKSNMMNT